jgi:hypothetical protein
MQITTFSVMNEANLDVHTNPPPPPHPSSTVMMSLANCIEKTWSASPSPLTPGHHLDLVIGLGLMLSLSIAKWHDSLNSQSLVYDGDRQAPQDILNLLPEGTDLDPDAWLMHHKSIPAYPRRNASTSSNRRSFGSKRYF